MRLHRVTGLPAAPLAAAAQFYAEHQPALLAALPGAGAALTLIFPPADHTHRAWRAAAIAELARAAVPGRVNALAGDDEVAIARAAEWLADAPGITGQCFELDGTGAGDMVSAGA